VTVLLVWTFICIQFSLLISNFISNESNIDYKITDARQLEFPSVTICNANPIKKSALEDLAANNVQLQNLLALGVSGDTRKRRRRKRSKVFFVFLRPFPLVSYSHCNILLYIYSCLIPKFVVKILFKVFNWIVGSPMVIRIRSTSSPLLRRNTQTQIKSVRPKVPCWQRSSVKIWQWTSEKHIIIRSI